MYTYGVNYLIIWGYVYIRTSMPSNEITLLFRIEYLYIFFKIEYLYIFVGMEYLYILLEIKYLYTAADPKGGWGAPAPPNDLISSLIIVAKA